MEAFEDESRQVAATVGPLGPLGSGSMPSSSVGGGAVVVSAVGQAAEATTAISASQSTSTNVQSFSAESHQQHQRSVVMSSKISERRTCRKINIK